jgi:hypothetical protein
MWKDDIKRDIPDRLQEYELGELPEYGPIQSFSGDGCHKSLFHDRTSEQFN